MNRLDAMEIFVRVAELNSFTRTAEALKLPKASVSTAVQGLEAALGTRLLHRTTRKVQLTQDGRAFYERSKDLLADMDELQALFQQGAQSLRGRLRVDMPASVARNFIIPRLPEFLRAHPQLEIELSSTDRKVDLVREGFDCVMRVGTLEDSALIARPLGSMRITTCASPAYLAARGMPQTLDDLAAHQLIHYSTHFDSKPFGLEYFDGERYRTQAMPGAITVNDTESYKAACLAGLGIIQSPVVVLQALLDSGALVPLPQFQAEPMPVSLVYAHRRNLSQRVQRFMAWLADAMAPYLDARA